MRIPNKYIDNSELETKVKELEQSVKLLIDALRKHSEEYPNTKKALTLQLEINTLKWKNQREINRNQLLLNELKKIKKENLTPTNKTNKPKTDNFEDDIKKSKEKEQQNQKDSIKKIIDKEINQGQK